MKEQSHKDEMSAALRGDFARLRDRGVAVTLAPPAADSTAAAPEPMAAAPAPSPSLRPTSRRLPWWRAQSPRPSPMTRAADEPSAPDPVTTAEPEPEPRSSPSGRAGGSTASWVASLTRP